MQPIENEQGLIASQKALATMESNLENAFRNVPVDGSFDERVVWLITTLGIAHTATNLRSVIMEYQVLHDVKQEEN